MPATRLLILGWELGDRVFGADVSSIIHIEPTLRSRGLPRPTPGIEALCVHSGRILPVIDLSRILLGETSSRRENGTVHLIMQSTLTPFAARVDRVQRIFPLDTDALELPPHDVDHPAAEFCQGKVTMDEQELWLVDIRRVLRRIGLTRTRA
jgi:chemotaxis signal transduction protein